ncbi:hypothetical protein ACFCZ1_36450 [Streptomyces sp. NPDC056224]|uniref:hypothetical protein n=1 Tax=Streptomyces sp. NPDC056224 TaxID=3345750 RepID=UPI0035D86795
MEPNAAINSKGIYHTIDGNLLPQSANIVLLDSGQPGTQATCKAETRYSTVLKREQLTKGSQICLTTSQGIIGLLTLRTLPGQPGAASNYYGFDLTYWRP